MGRKVKRLFDPLLWLRGGDFFLHFAKQFTVCSGKCFAKYFGQPLKTCHWQLFPPSASLYSNPLPSDTVTKKYSSKTAAVFFVVAGRGFEPPDLWVMSPTSYQAAPPRDIVLRTLACLINA